MKKILLIAAFATGTCLADTTPFMVSLVTPVQAPDRDVDVTGLRLDFIYGQSHDFKGLDIGVVNHTTGNFYGVALGGANLVNEEFYGVQMGLLNWNDNGNRAWAQMSYGAQVGLVNYADSFCGYQGGLVNIIANNGWMPVFPIVNGSF